MLERLTRVGDSQTGGVRPAEEPKGAQPPAPEPPHSDDIPAAPPAEVLDALDRAARVVGELGRKGISLSFDHDPAAQQLRVKVERGAGGTSHELSLHGLLNLLDGDTAVVLPRKG